MARNPNLRNAASPRGAYRKNRIDEISAEDSHGHEVAKVVQAFRPSRPPGVKRPTNAPPRPVELGELNCLFRGQTFKARAPVRVSMGAEADES